MQDEPQPRIRRTPIPAEAVLVVRGDELDPAVIEADAARFRRRFSAWGRFGISAFVAADEGEVDALCETKLRAWTVVPHVTLAHASLEELTERLVSCEHRIVVNPYHEPEIGPWSLIEPGHRSRLRTRPQLR